MPPLGYARAYQTQAVLTASPGQLVLMLYDGALRFLSIAQEAFNMEETNFQRFEVINKNLQRVQAIIGELQATLNYEVGGDFAVTMHRLYDFYNRRVFEANLKKDPTLLVDVEKFLREIRGAWSEMLRSQNSVAVDAEMRA